MKRLSPNDWAILKRGLVVKIAFVAAALYFPLPNGESKYDFPNVAVLVISIIVVFFGELIGNRIFQSKNEDGQ